MDYVAPSDLKVLLVVVLVASSGIGANVLTAGSSPAEGPIEPADAAAIRISDAEGLPSGGGYATTELGQRSVEGELGTLPTEHRVPIGTGTGYASIQKQAAGEIAKRRPW